MQEKNPEGNSEVKSSETQSKGEFKIAINDPDLSILNDQDPSLLNSFKIIYYKRVPMEIKLKSKNKEKDLASFEPIKCKLLIDNTNENNMHNHIKIELSSENDIYFHFTNIIDEKKFKIIKKEQNLNINYSEFCQLFEKMCENCRTYPNEYICFFILNKHGNSILKFIKNSDFKFVELLLLEFSISPEEVIKKQINYRFAYLKSKLDYQKKCIKLVGDFILNKNPDLLPVILRINDKYNFNVYNFFGKALVGK
jgi:hypothetical protein